MSDDDSDDGCEVKVKLDAVSNEDSNDVTVEKAARCVDDNVEMELRE